MERKANPPPPLNPKGILAAGLSGPLGTAKPMSLLQMKELLVTMRLYYHREGTSVFSVLYVRLEEMPKSINGVSYPQGMSSLL